ncbi:hypothetical protein [Maritimibacter sp. UBA3975]|uniref:hypothetical protein n=1 Tax=Maritimibacter sp. UBA3975 TaxID=1946833 RepID=UPI000C09AAEE|nr:hypothetical protein [Maritimibacter sp. UBA3975]MAM62586.1 hypothetical protein [Maritimibacter sp.]|tara:strand:- start:2005 stop:2457 length:453 start_codon:yes stop_codon:yes gene_type:complete
MTFKHFAAALALITTPAIAQNEEVHPYTKSNIAPVMFEYLDEAEDGCWTSADQAADIAKRALDGVGIAHTDDPEEAATTLFLYVDASRDGGCYGNMLLDLRGPATWAGEEVRVILRDSGANFEGYDNLNAVIPAIMDHFVGTELGGFPAE